MTPGVVTLICAVPLFALIRPSCTLVPGVNLPAKHKNERTTDGLLPLSLNRMSEHFQQLNSRLTQDLREIVERLTELERAYEHAQEAVRDHAIRMQMVQEANRMLMEMVDQVRASRTGEN
uniref:Chemotaxis protein n=1 Tax=Steinernema glaseri TaxID=37863 RepID=A0A1I7YME7_9BILA